MGMLSSDSDPSTAIASDMTMTAWGFAGMLGLGLSSYSILMKN